MTAIDPAVFENRNLLVTGAASGLGLAVCRAAADAGASVIALDVQDDAEDTLASNPNITYAHCDVSRLEDWQQIARLVRQSGTLDFVHLNAGIQIAPPDAPLADYQFEALSTERYRRMMGVNVDGVVFGLSSLLPLVSDGGAIVVTGSLAGVTPYAVDPLYAMSKHAVTGLVRSLAPALADRGVRLNAICPGGIDTAIIPHEQRSADAVFMTAEHVASEVLYLMTVEETGKTWAKVAESKPVFIIRAPGDRER